MNTSPMAAMPRSQTVGAGLYNIGSPVAVGGLAGYNTAGGSSMGALNVGGSSLGGSLNALGGLGASLPGPSSSGVDQQQYNEQYYQMIMMMNGLKPT